MISRIIQFISRIIKRQKPQSDIKPILIVDDHYYDEWTDTWHTETKRLI